MSGQCINGGFSNKQASGGGGSTTFTGLSDTPASYAGNALLVARVNAGETALEFAADSSGFADWKTIGTGGDFSDVQAMIDGGESKGFLLSNVTEDSNIAVPTGGFALHLNDFTLTMAANQFTFAAEAQCTVVGWGPATQIDYTQTVVGEECFDTGAFTGSTVTLRDFTFDNNSSASGTHLAKSDSILLATGLTIENPNVADVGVELNNSKSLITQSLFTSPGTTNSNALVLVLGKASDITFSGTWNNVGITLEVRDSAVATNIISNGQMAIHTRGQLSNVWQESGAIRVFTTGFDGHFTNGFVFSVTINSGDDDNFFENLTIESSIVDSTTGENNAFNNCQIEGNQTFTGDGYRITGCEFDGTLTINNNSTTHKFAACKTQAVSVVGDNNTFVGCTSGNFGGGSATITVDASSDGTILVGNRVDVDIVDNGTNTVLIGNLTF